MIDSKVPDRVGFGTQVMKEVKEVLRLWHRFKQGEIGWEEFQNSTIPIAKNVNELLYAGMGSHDSKLKEPVQIAFHAPKTAMSIHQQSRALANEQPR